MQNRVAIAMMMTVMAIGLAGESRADFVTQGSFEQTLNPTEPIAGSNFYQRFGGGYSPSGELLGWEVTSGTVDLLNTSNFWYPGLRADDESIVMQLNGDSQGAISQQFATDAGSLYRLSFAYAGSPETASADMARVELTGSMQLAQADITASEASSWSLYSSTFTADSAMTTLAFSSLQPGSHGVILDSVGVSAVPEPSSLALVGLGTAAVLVVHRRRR